MKKTYIKGWCIQAPNFRTDQFNDIIMYLNSAKDLDYAGDNSGNYYGIDNYDRAHCAQYISSYEWELFSISEMWDMLFNEKESSIAENSHSIELVSTQKPLI